MSGWGHHISPRKYTNSLKMNSYSIDVVIILLILFNEINEMHKKIIFLKPQLLLSSIKRQRFCRKC